MPIKEPEETAIGWIKIPVEWVDKIDSREDEHIFGKYVSGHNRKIVLAKSEDEQALLDTIIHEGLHAAEEVMGHELPHILVHTISLYLTQYLSPFILGGDDE